MNLQTIAYGRALYYPYIHFRDSKWLKTAALYYKGLDRIVPINYDLQDSDLVKQLNEQEDFVRNISPENRDRKEVAENFLRFARKELADSRGRDRLLTDIGAVIPTDERISIHMDKIAYILQNELPRLGLASRDESYGRNNWYEFEPVTGALYMTFLANYLAKKRRLPVVTDNPLFQPFLQPFEETDYENRLDVGEALAALVIESVVPEDIENIPIKKILEFRNKYDDERHLFYNEINNLAEELKSIEHPQALQDCLEHKKKSIVLAVNNLKGALKSMKIATTTTLFGLSIPSTMMSESGFVIEAARFVAVAIGTFFSHHYEHKSKKYSSYSYVLSLQKNLKSETLAEQMVKRKIIL